MKRSGDASGDPSGDASGDPSGDGRWLTYDELAKLRRISRASAERLVFRNHWRRQRGNDRTVRALVPLDYLSGEPSPDDPDMSPDPSPDLSRDNKGLLAGALSALEGAVAALREQLAGAEKRADAAIALVDQTMAALADSNARTDRAETDVRELRERLEQAEAAAEQARRKAVHEAREAAQALDALRAVEAARLAQGLLARLRAAWRGR